MTNPVMNEVHDAARRAYQAARLKVYGTVTELTLTVNLNMNKNDEIQGGTNFKT